MTTYHIPEYIGIRGHFYKDLTTKEIFEGNSNYAIEYCFYGCVGSEDYCKNEKSFWMRNLRF